MKKAALFMVIICALTLCGCYDKTPSSTSGQTGSTQGQIISNNSSDNRYYFYTNETDKNGCYDISLFEKSVYNSDTECWYPADENFKNYSQYTEKNGYTTLTPSDNVSAILAFKAPADGNYRFELCYNVTTVTQSSDGVTVSVYAHDTRLYSRQTESAEETFTEIVTLNAMLKKDQYFSIIVDPNKDSIGDLCNGISVEVFHTLTTYVDNKNAWCFGPSYVNGDGATQGANGWYILAADADDLSALSDLKECLFVPSDTSYTKETEGKWIPADFTDDKNNSDLQTFIYTSTGIIMPEIGETCRTVAIAFKAPEDGEYRIDLWADKYNAMGSAPNDIKLSLYANETLIKEINAEEILKSASCVEVTLKKDQQFICLVDTKDKDSFITDFSILVQKEGT